MQNNNEIKQDDTLLEVKNLKMYFDITTGFFKTTPLKAVDNVSFSIKKGETLGVVGESGCGKTTLGRSIMNLYNPSSGDVIFEGMSISAFSDLKKIQKERKFELRMLKFDSNKKFKDQKKIEFDKVNEELSTKKASLDATEFKNTKAEAYALVNQKLVEYRQELQRNLQVDIAALNEKYDQKYEEKKAEITSKLESIEATKNEALSKLEVVAKSTDPSTSDVDSKIAVLKEEANRNIASAKQEMLPKLEAAKEVKNEAMVKLQEKKSEDKQKLASSSNKKKTKKDNWVEERVMYEKIIADYHIEKSKAYGKYQKTKNEIKSALKADIKNIRQESKYYSYIDAKNDIIDAYKTSKKRVKSSAKYRMKNFRKQCTMVFQDPYSSLNPRMTVQDIIAEPLDVNHLYSTKEERRSKVLELMKKVGLSPEQSTRYAHEFSGGQRQRIGIARALAVNPQFIVCDEPVSALDVSIQAQVINTFEDLQNELGLTYLFIAHDLLVVRHISDRIAVMYLGKVVELAETNELFNGALHPYTISLLSAVPQPDPKTARANKRIILEGDVPSPLNVPSGCPFRTRCPRACERCKTEIPTLQEVKPGHFVSCILVQNDANDSFEEEV